MRSASWPKYCVEKYQEARRNMDTYEKRFGTLVSDLLKEQVNIDGIKFKIQTYIAYNFARRLLIAIIIVELYYMAWA